MRNSKKFVSSLNLLDQVIKKCTESLNSIKLDKDDFKKEEVDMLVTLLSSLRYLSHVALESVLSPEQYHDFVKGAKDSFDEKIAKGIASIDKIVEGK